MKHTKFDSRNFKKKVSRLCKVCQKQCLKGSKFCSIECKNRFKKEPNHVWTSPIFQNDSASTKLESWRF